MIPPEVRHRVHSERGVEAVIVSVPAFNPDDEHFDNEPEASATNCA